MKLKPLLISLLTIQMAVLTPTPASAIDVGSFASGFDFKTGPSEYVIQEHPNQKLISVRLLSGVVKPGLYRIPTETNLVTLLSYSGGLSKSADTSEISIKNPGTEPIKKLSLEEIMKTTGNGPTMKNRDILIIPEKEPLIGADTLTVVSLTSSILGIIAIAFALSDRE